jgi:pyruvate-ferredoxin/flavodoxin oxidoreductase
MYLQNGLQCKEEDPVQPEDEPDFVSKIQRPMARLEGDELPVSTFTEANMEDGTFPMGTTAYEKRGIAVNVPEWQIDNCIQCNQCSLVCPHAVIRPYLLNDEELAKAPETFDTKKACRQRHGRAALSHTGKSAWIAPAAATVPISALLPKALIMKDAEEQIDLQYENAEFATTVTDKEGVMAKNHPEGQSVCNTPV